MAQTDDFKRLAPLLDGVHEASTTSLPGSPAPVEYGCPVCSDMRFVMLEREIGDPEFGTMVRCEACRPALRPVGIPEGLQAARFGNFSLAINPKAKPMLDAVKAVVSGESWCALLVGDPGRGKSHLAASALVERWGWYWEWGSLLRHMRRQMFDGPELDRLTEEEALRPWCTNPMLLVLDDVGAEKATDWSTAALYAIVNDRYQAKLPLIVTTNNGKAIEDRVLSRMFSGTVLVEGGVDVRRERRR